MSLPLHSSFSLSSQLPAVLTTEDIGVTQRVLRGWREHAALLLTSRWLDRTGAIAWRSADVRALHLPDSGQHNPLPRRVVMVPAASRGRSEMARDGCPLTASGDEQTCYAGRRVRPTNGR
jgi:hypothetical protein